MEEQIRKIMDAELMGDAGDSERCAEKITSHIMEFIEWLTSFGNHHISRCGKGWRIESNYSDPYKEFDIEEVYQHWLTNIKNQSNDR